MFIILQCGKNAWTGHALMKRIHAGEMLLILGRKLEMRVMLEVCLRQYWRYYLYVIMLGCELNRYH